MARIDVVMPQMGESIAEGTLSRWLKKAGDPVKRDEPIFEISTDKVDAEIPAPSAGVLAEILVQEGETVAVQTVVGRIETEAGAATPGLTTVRQPHHRKGAEAVRLLLADDPAQNVLLPTELVIRASTGPAPRKESSP